MLRNHVSNPYLFETATSLIGQQIIVITANNKHQGLLTAVLPDHIVVESIQSPNFIRMEEIVWITLKPSNHFFSA
ncbi:DUF2642 domain-containing protein [Lysinibacillus sp. 54212]|uniref:DUF2642 domain-containing protein n=1 Tax=Lysinibacillus sp. 54212 TaxID=3119829 RepID=UPI002FC760AE